MQNEHLESPTDRDQGRSKGSDSPAMAGPVLGKKKKKKGFKKK